MTRLVYPDLRDLHVVHCDTVTSDYDAAGFSAVYAYTGTDRYGNDWRWFEYHTYSFAEGAWLPVDVRGLERVE